MLQRLEQLSYDKSAPVDLHLGAARSPLRGQWLRLPNAMQGGLVSRRADPPSQDRRSLGYLVSLPPLAREESYVITQLMRHH